MFRLGLRLTLNGGREALVRLILTTIAVGIGVIVLLAVLADFHAYQATSNRPSWESTQGIQGNVTNEYNVELWNYSENLYKGQFIEQLDLAQLGHDAPVIPGIPKIPGPGEYYASPALSNLLATVPKDELGDRFQGKQIGLIGQSALSFPTELAIVIGFTPSQLQNLPGTIEVNKIANGAQLQGTTNIYKIAFGIGAIAVLFPILILINTATRLAATRREERYAAMRLVGATSRQINLIATVDAVIGALFGVVLGILVFLLIRPEIANISLSGVKFFENEVTPTALGYIAMIVIVPIAAAIASLISLRRVQVSPLGVSRKTTPPPPRAWRFIPLIVGIPVFIYPILTASSATNSQKNGNPSEFIFIGFFLIFIGLVLSGSWLTMQISKVLGRYARGASTLLASRHLADNPKVAFRSVSGLVLAIFAGSIIAIVAPTINAAQSPITNNSLNNILKLNYNSGPPPQAQGPQGPGNGIGIKNGQNSQQPQYYGISPQATNQLINKLQSFNGTKVIPVYDNSSYQNILSCSTLKYLPVFGECAPGLKYVEANNNNIQNLLFTDNPLFVNKSVPIVMQSSQGIKTNLTNLYLQAMFVKTPNSNTLEQVRTYLTNYDQSVQSLGGSGNLSGWQMGQFEPETFGELALIRNNDDNNIEKIILAIVGITIIVAGCSLAVTVGGSLVERKRPFTLLRLSGSPVSILYKDIILEAAVPLITASVAAAAIGVGITVPVINSLLTSVAPQIKHAYYPSPIFYIAIGSCLVVSIILITLTLPLLKRITMSENARFE